MRALLPCAIFVLIVAALLVVYHRSDPRHDFVFELTRRLAESAAESSPTAPQGEERQRNGSRAVAGGHHRSGGAHV